MFALNTDTRTKCITLCSIGDYNNPTYDLTFYLTSGICLDDSLMHAVSVEAIQIIHPPLLSNEHLKGSVLIAAANVVPVRSQFR